MKQPETLKILEKKWTILISYFEDTSVYDMLIMLLCALLSATSGNEAGATLASLLAKYGSSSTRPGLSWAGDGSVDNAEVQIYVDQFHGINQIRQTWGLTGYMRTWWTDKRLAFNATSAGVNRLPLNAHEATLIWQPDLYFEGFVHTSDI